MAKKNNKGWIIVHRQILDSEIWNAEDPFSFRDAWIDLLLRANHADRGLILKNGTRITVDKGTALDKYAHPGYKVEMGKQKSPEIP